MYQKWDSRWCLSLAILIFGVGYVLQGFAQNIWHLYIINAIQGMSMVVLILFIGAELIGKWFVKNVGFMIGLAGCLRALGGAIFNGLGGWMIDTVDWRWTFIVFGLVNFVFSLPFAFLVRKEPSVLGLKPYGIESVKPEEQKVLSKPVGLTFKRLRKMPMFWALTLAIMLTPFCNVLYGYLNDYLQTQKGLTSTEAGFCNSALMIGGTLSYVLTGLFYDKNYKAGIAFCMLGAVIAYPVLALTNGLGYVAFLICFFLIGVTYQPTCGVLEPNVVRDTCGTKDYSDIWAFHIAALNFLGALGSTVWGLCIEGIGYMAMFILCAALYLVLGLVFIGIIRLSHTKWSKMPEWAAEEN